MHCKMQLIHCVARQMGKSAHAKSAHRSNFFGASFAGKGILRGARPLAFDGVIWCLMLVMFRIYVPKRIF
tara:strand:- start:673 stop:882 length:210 start_codon:yes stop_codon:yes gene_type:complete